MATLTECRNRHSSSISHGGLIGELCSYESVQLHKSSWQQEAGEKPSGDSLLVSHAVQMKP